MLLVSAWWWDSRLAARQNALANQIAERQDELARVLADRQKSWKTRFVREIATAQSSATKPFAGLNLASASLSGLPLGCANVELLEGCADFERATLTDADHRYTNLTGANLVNANLAQANLFLTHLSRARLLYAYVAGATLAALECRSSSGSRRQMRATRATSRFARR